MSSPLDKSQVPVCTVDRARELGLDVSKVPTCHPEKLNGVRGCSQWRSCRFNRPEFGGFKGTGPKMIGYFLRPYDGPPKTDICACHTFVMAVQPLMDEGIALRMQGKTGQVVRIVAQEGQPIKVRRFPQKMVNGVLVTKPEVAEIPVPAYPDPTELDQYMEYERDIMDQYAKEYADEVAVPQDNGLNETVDMDGFGAVEPEKVGGPLAAPVKQKMRP